MKIEKIFTKNVVSVSDCDKASKALSLMEKNRIHQLPVIESGKLLGMILLKDIIMEDIDPSTTNVKNIMRKNITTLNQNSTEIEAAKYIIGSGFRALPVIEGQKVIGMLSETDLMDFVDADITAKDVMESPITLNQNEGIGKAKQIFREEHISRLPIVDDDGKAVGTLDTLDMIKTMKPQERQSLNKSGEGEKIQTSKIPVKDMMRSTGCLSEDADITEIVKVLKIQEEAIVSDGGKPVGIITPKDIIELLLIKSPDNRIQILHMDKDESVLRDSIYDIMEKWMNKSGSDIDNIFIYVHKHAKSGKSKYSMHARIVANDETISIKSFGWDALTSAQNIVKKAGKVIEKKQGKNKRRNIERKIASKRWVK